MENGLYKVDFQTPLGAGHGVIYFADGKVRGGDSMMFYHGEYTLANNSISAQVQVDRHSQVPGMTSVLGQSKASLNLQGAFEGSSAVLKGTSPQAPGLAFTARISKIAD